MVNDILIGFEVGTGAPVKMREHHGVVSGQTQMSGKTTTIKALISRSGRKAVIFLTKRGEIEFHGLNQVQPYFKEQTGWRYIKSLLEAQEQRRMVFNEPWIIKSCEGVKTLRGVLENTERLMKAARRDFDKDQYLVLIEYLKVVVPAVESRPWARSLPLEKGINVMDLVELPVQMQALVIQSTLNYIMDKMRGVIAVIPEAWKFMPKSGNPVKLAAENYIRQGASIGNYLLIDSQDLAGVDTAILKQCNNWLMGFQRELNEAKRVAETAGHRITVSMIQSLKRGHFVASLGVENPQLVYVWPEGVPMQMAIDVAMGLLSPEVVKDYLAKMRSGKEDGDEEMYRELCEKTQRELEKVRGDKEALERRLEELQEHQPDSGELQQLRQRVTELEGLRDRQASNIQALEEKARRFEGVDVDKLNETIAAFREEIKDYTRLRSALIGFLRIDEAQAAERPVPAQAAVDVNDVAAIVDVRLAQVIRESPPSRVVAINVSEAFRELIREGFVSEAAEKIRSLTEEPRKIAIQVRERSPIKTSELYFMARGKPGRIPANFYGQINHLENAHLVTYTKNTGLVSWTLDEFVDGKLIDLADNEARRQIKEYLASLLLPVTAPETR